MKILTTIMSMALAIGVMGIAVFAAATQTLTVTNTVSFYSNHVLAELSLTASSAESYMDAIALEEPNLFSQAYTMGSDDDDFNDTWEMGDWTFVQYETIYITLTITNTKLEGSMWVTVAQTNAGDHATNAVTEWAHTAGGVEETDNVNRTIEATIDGIPVVDYAGGETQVAAGETLVVIITLAIAEDGVSVAPFDNGFVVTMEDNSVWLARQ